jgi:hypothetical protein
MAGKKKERSVRKVIEFDIEKGEDIKSLIEFSKTEEAKELGFFTSSDAAGFTIGKGLSSFEEEGEGLPDGTGVEMTFDFRVVIEEGGAVELQVARKGSGRRSRFRIEGLPDPSVGVEKDGRLYFDNRQLSASSRFLVNLDTALAYYSYLLLRAYLAEKDPLEKKRRLYDKVVRDIETRFRPLLYLDPSKQKEIERSEIQGIKVTTYAPSRGGRTRGTKGTRKPSGKEKARKVQFLNEIVQAIRELNARGGNLDKKSVIAKHLGMPYSTFIGRLKSAGLYKTGNLERLISKITSE